MAENHGVFVAEASTSVSAVNTATSGIPFVIGIAPLSKADADKRATAGVPVLATSFAEAEEHLGYSDQWEDYTLCEFMYYHFKLAACQPVIFLPLAENLQTQKFNGDGTAREFTVTAKPERVLGVTVGQDSVTVSAYDKATGKVTLETAPATGTDNVTVTYLVKPAASVVAAAVENIDLCMTMFSMVPDLIAAPGFSTESVVAAAMAAKIASVNGLFRGRAVIDLTGESYTAAIGAKNEGSFTENMILCWPNLKLGNLTFHGSTVEAGRIAMTDVENGNVPNETPSNKPVSADSLVSPSGAEVQITWTQGNILNAAGINTFINWFGSRRAWGNYTGCYPGNNDVKDYLIPVARMFDWVANTLIKTFWGKLDDPMNRRLIDSILDSVNIWLNGLVGQDYLLGARAVMLDAENPKTDLMAGIVRIHLYMTPASPMQEIDFTLEYDVSYVESALSG